MIPRSDGLVEFREPGTNWLLALFDPASNRLQIQRDGVRSVVDFSPPVLGTKADRGFGSGV